MKHIFFISMLLACSAFSHAQHTLRLIIRDAENKTPLQGATATVTNAGQSAIADSSGLVVFNLPAGDYKVSVNFLGHEVNNIQVRLPLTSTDPVEVLMEEEHEHEEEVIISTTRTSRTIANSPTRMEVISGEELAEKANMKPGDIRMLLSETTGIQVQQTSATSYNAGIRIQGLDGRYTQMLRDGYPLYSGFAGGLSILQIAPLDLRQVEV
ncbi:MAG: TonB-dependent receptor plug domain-containing protein, partial [Flavisolibacter sp.]